MSDIRDHKMSGGCCILCVFLFLAGCSKQIGNDPYWTSRYSPEIPYMNRSDKPVSMTIGADPKTQYIGEIKPGEGGYVQ